MTKPTSVVSGKILIALRAARSAAGWTQAEFAEKMGVAKSTVARIEKMDMAPTANYVVQGIMLFQGVGIDVDLFNPDKLHISIRSDAIEMAVTQLTDPANRRSDRKVI